jgi:hypothetical protein
MTQSSATGKIGYVKPKVVKEELNVSRLIIAEVSSHEAETNPHPNYLTEAEGDVLYKAYLTNLSHTYEDLLVKQEEHNIQDMLANERHSSGIRGYENR